MSFGGDQSTSMQGMTSKMFSTLLGGNTDNLALKPSGETQGKKPKAKSPVATFLGSDATPSRGMGATMLGSAG